jgi:hypothetical protein
MSWMPLVPKRLKKRRLRSIALTPRKISEEEKLSPMRWQLDPISPAAEALRNLKMEIEDAKNQEQ